MKTVLSGIQPTGNLHLGNYLGSIRNWIDLQDSHRCIFGIMNLHAITVPQDPKELRQNVLDAAAIYLACGLDPKKSTIFVQGEVAAHAELAWVLGTLTPLGWLNRMTQFKDKVKVTAMDDLENTKLVIQNRMKEEMENYDKLCNDGLYNLRKTFINTLRHPFKGKGILNRLVDFNKQQKEINNQIVEKGNKIRHYLREEMNTLEEKNRKIINEIYDFAQLGLYSYPVLMASDILLYKADLVPVGEDQKQHLELTRDLAGAFNRRFGKEYFKLPEPMIIKEVKRIMSLQDGAKKMSKSDESDLSRINLTDSAESIIKKVKKAKTDSQTTVSFEENRPEIYNLLNIFTSFTGKAPEAIAKEYENSGYGKFKGDLAEVIVEKLRPIQQNVDRFKKDPSYIRQILDDGKNKAQEIAAKTKEEVFEIVGLV